MKNITKEKLAHWLAQIDKDGACDATDSQVEKMMRMLLAGMVQEPVAYTDNEELSFQEHDGWMWKTPHDFNRDIPLYTTPKPAVPDGWKLVPTTAMPSMVKAGAAAAKEYMEETGGNSPYVIYQAMIAAAPAPVRSE